MSTGVFRHPPRIVRPRQGALGVAGAAPVVSQAWARARPQQLRRQPLVRQPEIVRPPVVEVVDTPVPIARPQRRPRPTEPERLPPRQVAPPVTTPAPDTPAPIARRRPLAWHQFIPKRWQQDRRPLIMGVLIPDVQGILHQPRRLLHELFRRVWWRAPIRDQFIVREPADIPAATEFCPPNLYIVPAADNTFVVRPDVETIISTSDNETP